MIMVIGALKVDQANRYIRAGICGAVKDESVFTLREGADLSMLIRMARGTRGNADLSEVNLNTIIRNDSIYHIPAKGKNTGQAAAIRLLDELQADVKSEFDDIEDIVKAHDENPEIRKYTILYVGLPAVFVLINYYPDFNRINFVHIPHVSTFLNNEYRLIDIFLNLDIYPTMQIVGNKLNVNIDYYLIQDRFEFIDLVDELGGVDVRIDKAYAKVYDMQPGMGHIDGYHSWEYIRFVDWRTIKMKVERDRTKDLVRQDNFKADPGEWERIYEVRNQRQRYILQGMRKAFINLSAAEQLQIVATFSKVFSTDMSLEFLNKLYRDILSTPEFSFGALPGYYSREGEKLFFYPDLPNFEMLRQQKIREYLEKRKNKTQTIY